jgi:hypothetical protein
MFHPAWLGKNLIVFDLMPRDFPALAIEHHESGARRPLIERAHITTHAASLKIVNS